MDPQQLLLILEAAQKAIADGKPMHLVNQFVSEDTNGEFPGMMSLALAIDPSVLAGSSDEQLQEIAHDEAFVARPEVQRTSARGGNAVLRGVQDFGEEALSGLTFDFADEFLGEDFKQRQEDRRTLNPVASGLSQAAGLLVPGAAAGRLAAKGTAGFVKGAAKLAGVGAAESGLLAAGGAEGGIGERAKSGAIGAAFGGAVGGFFGVGLPIARGVSRLLRTDKMLARLMARETVEQTGQTADELFDALRQRKALVPGETATLADISPELHIQAERFATGGTNSLRRQGGPLDQLRERVKPEWIRKAKDKVFAPFNDKVLDAPPLLAVLGEGKHLKNATRSVIDGDPQQLQRVGFRQLQSIRNDLDNQFQSARRLGNVDAMSEVMAATAKLDEQIGHVLPGYAKTNAQYIELLARQDGAEELIRAIDKALPMIQPEVPQVGGLFSSVYKSVSEPAKRRRLITNMVGEALLADGEAGIKSLEALVRSGKMARFFLPLQAEVRKATRGVLLAQPGGLIQQQ